MGRTFDHALGLVDSHNANQDKCTAGLAMRDPATNLYYEDAITYEEDSRGSDDNVWSHVEKRLLAPFLKAKNNGAAIPNSARIVLACNWSPCRNCYTYIIPTFMKKIEALSKNIQLKFRFRKYYSKQVVGTSSSLKHLWDDNDKAQEAYDELVRKYRSHIKGTDYDTIFDPETEEPTEVVKTTFTRWHLVIADATVAKTREKKVTRMQL